MPRMHDDFLEWQRLRAGPLGPHVEAFAETLTEKGYPPATVALKVRQAAKFGHWLGRQGFTVDEVDEQAVARFIQLHPCAPRRGDGATLRDVLEQVVPPAWRRQRPPKVDDTAIGRNRERVRPVSGGGPWPVRSRLGINYLPIVRSFLAERFDGRKVHLNGTRAPGCG